MAKSKKNQVQEEEEEDGDDEYEVNQIKNHRRGKKQGLEYFVSWVGYPNDEDDCWISEESAEGAPDAIEAYWKTVSASRLADRYEPGKAPPASKKGAAASATKGSASKSTSTPTTAASGSNKRSATKAADAVEESARSKKKITTNGDVKEKEKPKPKEKEDKKPGAKTPEKKKKKAASVVEEDLMEVEDSAVEEEEDHGEVDGRKFFAHEVDYAKTALWEPLVDFISTIEKEEDPNGELKFFVIWKADNTYSWVNSVTMRSKAPQKVIDFYEQHLKFSPAKDDEEA